MDKDDWDMDKDKPDHHDEDKDENDDSWGWLNDTFGALGPFISDPDVLCPLLGMIGPGWEDGCKQSMQAYVTHIVTEN